MTMIELANENKLLKSLLHGTTRSCNNCGKVNCENFQRQRVDSCGHWKSFIEYISELEEKNAGFKESYERLRSMGFPTFQSAKEYADKLNRAKEIISNLVSMLLTMECDDEDIEETNKAEAFLEEN